MRWSVVRGTLCWAITDEKLSGWPYWRRDHTRWTTLQRFQCQKNQIERAFDLQGSLLSTYFVAVLVELIVCLGHWILACQLQCGCINVWKLCIDITYMRQIHQRQLQFMFFVLLAEISSQDWWVLWVLIRSFLVTVVRPRNQICQVFSYVCLNFAHELLATLTSVGGINAHHHAL